MKNRIFACMVCAVLISAFCTSAARADSKKPVVQLAILLDTSNSMDGLIDQAKSQLWEIVNEFIKVKKNGERPVLKVALYEYGNDSLNRENGYIRQVLALTDDLDAVSQKLFELKTNGGSEYCGQVIDRAADFLKWSKSSDDLKVVYIAGNEPFTQGPVDYKKAMQKAVGKGIIVNTIHCGDFMTGVNGKWKDGAMLAEGQYFNIDQNSKAVYIEAPQDKEITRLGLEINKTYIPYGDAGMHGLANQAAQDSNAVGYSMKSMINRSVTKTAAQYSNAGWDLVDAVDNKKVRLKDVKDDELPEAMRKMSKAERAAYLDKKRSERKDLQKKISALNAERVKYVSVKRKELAEKGEDSFDSAVRKSIRELLKAKGFETE